MITREQVIEAAKQCFDPEIPVNIWDLGLIYDVNISDNGTDVNIRMSLTTQHCPSAQMIPQNLKTQIMKDVKPKNVTVDVVFNPPWTPERISEEGKKKLGLTEGQ